MIARRRLQAEALVQLEILTTYGAVDVQGKRDGFEVSVFPPGTSDHSHFGGATLVDAIDAAFQATTRLPLQSSGKGDP